MGDARRSLQERELLYESDVVDLSIDGRIDAADTVVRD